MVLGTRVLGGAHVRQPRDYTRDHPPPLQIPQMLAFRTQGYNGYGVQYLPFFDDKLAVATAANYGLVGNGRLYILQIDPLGNIISPILWETQDGLFDVAWSELNENQVAVASGDGLIKLFDATVAQFPVMNYHEHTREVFSVNWNMRDKQMFCLASWDGLIKVWSADRVQSLVTLQLAMPQGPPGPAGPVAVNTATTQLSVPMSHQQQHQGTANPSQCVYTAIFSPHQPQVLMSCNGGLKVQIWDIRAPQPLQQEFIAHNGMEALSCDWNKYRPSVICLGGTDKAVRVWDLRMVGAGQANIRGPTPVNEFIGHQFAVRKCQWSPHDGHELVLVSHDMTARVWRDESGLGRLFNGGALGVMGKHREFVIGCDYSLWGQPGWVATTGWDEMVYVWDSHRL